MQRHPHFPIPLVVARGDSKIKPVCVCVGEWVGAQCAGGCGCGWYSAGLSRERERERLGVLFFPPFFVLVVWCMENRRRPEIFFLVTLYV